MSLQKPDEIEMAAQLADLVQGAFLDSAEDDEVARYQSYHDNLVKTPAPDGLTPWEIAMAACSFAERALRAHDKYVTRLGDQARQSLAQSARLEPQNEAAPEGEDREARQSEADPQDWKIDKIWADELFEKLWPRALSDKDAYTDVNAFYEALKNVSIRTVIESISRIIYGNRASESDRAIARDIADEWHRSPGAPGQPEATETLLGMAAFELLGQVLKGQVDRQKAARSKARDQPAAVPEPGEEEESEYERDPYGQASYGPNDIN